MSALRHVRRNFVAYLALFAALGTGAAYGFSVVTDTSTR